ncbi:MAG: ABC transporter substrate-binding protein [Brachybacterium sp.]|nr:ABC transporter substrate-binding protein [Brachybacterium sp.]
MFGLAGAGMGAFALSACGGGPTVGGGGDGEDAAEEFDLDFDGVEPADSIDFWTNHPGGSSEVEQEIISAFTEDTGIDVNIVTAGSNYEEIAQRFQTAQQGSSGLPAVVVLSDVWWFRYYMNRNIIPLDELISKLDVDIDDYRQTLVEDYQYEDRQWAMPYGRSTPLFYYNRDHFEEAGLPDRAPETWSEFAEWAPELTQGDTAYMYPDLDGYAGWILQNVLWGNGGSWSNEWDLNITSSESLEAMQWVQDSVYSDGWAQLSSADSADSFAAQACSATINSTGSLIGVLEAASFDVGVGFLPAGDVDGPVCPTGGAGLGIPAEIDKEQQVAGAMLIKWFGEPENTAKFSAATGYMPNRESSDMSAIIEETPQIQTAIDQLEHTRTQDYARVFFPGADQEMAQSVASLLSEEADVEQTMESLQETLQGIYDNEVEPNL